MPKHRDDELVVFRYASMENVTFHGSKTARPLTWGEWRDMSAKEKGETLDAVALDLVEVWVEDDEGR